MRDTKHISSLHPSLAPGWELILLPASTALGCSGTGNPWITTLNALALKLLQGEELQRSRLLFFSSFSFCNSLFFSAGTLERIPFLVSLQGVQLLYREIWALLGAVFGVRKHQGESLCSFPASSSLSKQRNQDFYFSPWQ